MKRSSGPRKTASNLSESSIRNSTCTPSRQAQLELEC